MRKSMKVKEEISPVLIEDNAEKPISDVPDMSKEEAIALLEKQRQPEHDQRFEWMEFVKRNGHKALGYTNVAKCIKEKSKTEYTNGYIYQMLKVAKTEITLFGHSARNNRPSISISLLNELSKLNKYPNKQQQAWLEFQGIQADHNLDGQEREIRKIVARLLADTQKPAISKTAPRPPVLNGITAQISEILQRKGQVILYGPPGTGKTHWAQRATQEMAARSWFQKEFNQLSGREQAAIVGTEQQPDGAVRMCCFHPTYGYEDFLEGYRPEIVDGQMIFQLRAGIFKHLCEDAARQPNRDFFLIIDEINRGDIPRIFGELLTILERNKRGKFVLLPLTGKPFKVPSNVYILGTMNTADRSIALLDAALRRRFGFVELMPNSQLFGQTSVNQLPLGAWFDKLNESIVQHVGRDGRNLQIGHSYLLTDTETPVSDVLSFARVLAEDIIPLLQEYCYEDYATLERILGDAIVDTSKRCIRAGLFAHDRGGELIEALLARHPVLRTHTVVSKSASLTEGNAVETADVSDDTPGNSMQSQATETSA